jgi:hypothetical protein
MAATEFFRAESANRADLWGSKGMDCTIQPPEQGVMEWVFGRRNKYSQTKGEQKAEKLYKVKIFNMLQNRQLRYHKPRKATRGALRTPPVVRQLPSLSPVPQNALNSS